MIVINDIVFQVVDIGWEWGMLAATIIVYLSITEIYKLFKRLFEKRRTTTDNDDIETNRDIRLAPTMEPTNN